VPNRCTHRRVLHPVTVINGKDLRCVAIQPSPHPLLIKEGQFEQLNVRTGHSTRLLTLKEAIDCCKTR